MAPGVFFLILQRGCGVHQPEFRLILCLSAYRALNLGVDA
jgi:hypothetical protein